VSTTLYFGYGGPSLWRDDTGALAVGGIVEEAVKHGLKHGGDFQKTAEDISV